MKTESCKTRLLKTSIFFELKLVARAVFNRVSKVIRELLWFFFTSLSDWFKALAPLFQPIRSETKTIY